MEGSGITNKMAEKMIHRLYVSLGSIKAGNTSSKLRRAVVSLLAELKRRGLSQNSRETNFQGFMQSLSLLIDSQLARLRNPNGRNKSHDFRGTFNPPIELNKGKNYRAAMNMLITMTYMWYNLVAR